MKPTINMHGIVKIEVSDIDKAEESSDCHAYTSRSITFIDKNNERFTIQLFGKSILDLQIQY